MRCGPSCLRRCVRPKSNAITAMRHWAPFGALVRSASADHRLRVAARYGRTLAPRHEGRTTILFSRFLAATGLDAAFALCHYPLARHSFETEPHARNVLRTQPPVVTEGRTLARRRVLPRHRSLPGSHKTLSTPSPLDPRPESRSTVPRFRSRAKYPTRPLWPEPRPRDTRKGHRVAFRQPVVLDDSYPPSATTTGPLARGSSYSLRLVSCTTPGVPHPKRRFFADMRIAGAADAPCAVRRLAPKPSRRPWRSTPRPESPAAGLSTAGACATTSCPSSARSRSTPAPARSSWSVLRPIWTAKQENARPFPRAAAPY